MKTAYRINVSSASALLKAKVARLLLIFLLPLSLSVTAQEPAQPPAAKLLETTVYRYNNQFHYDSSKLAISAFLQTPGLPAESAFYAYLYLSYTYKRLFDYASTLQYLDSASFYGLQTNTPIFFSSYIACQRALAFFDTHQYHKADSVMQILHKQNYRYLDEENQSKIIMQEAYLRFQKKEYAAAGNLYAVALAKMQASSPCDQPMIFGKLIELYGAMHNHAAMAGAYQKALHCADSCGIIKYRMYATEMMAQALGQIGQYKDALYYTHLLDSLNEVYNSTEHRDRLLELEAQYQNRLKEQEIALQNKSIQWKNLFIVCLVVSLIGMGFGMMYYILRQRQLKLQQDRINSQRYTVQLLQKTEEDRKHIAGHLHDSISHELLNLKHMLNGNSEDVRQRIDMLIDDVRHISHHLHPVVFVRVGLVHSLEQLIQRVQVKNNFMLTAELDYHKALSADAELQLYRIVQEAVTNMLKHAHAVAGKITIRQQPNCLFVEIKDNGKGFDVNGSLNSDKAFGLHNILERSRTAGGKAVIKSDSAGTVITLKIPLPTA